jgi:uncharacterized membrane protein
MNRIKTVLRYLLSAGMVFIGIRHFVDPEPFVRIVPAMFPEPRMLVLVSGFFEILGGLGLLLPWTRRAAAWGLIALYVAVFPANVNMAVNHLPMGDQVVPPIALWLRLPLQAVFIAWAYWFTRPEVAAGKDQPRG